LRAGPISLVFSRKDALQPAQKVKNPVSLDLRAGSIALVFSQQYFVTASLQGEKPGF
jgi:hypothetical protein